MRIFKNWLMCCGMLLLVVLTGCNAKSGLDGDTTEAPPPPANQNGIAQRTIDATKTDEWVYFNLASNAVVYPADPNNSSDWDIAFQRFKIKTNSGVNGAGDVEIAVLKQTAFAGVETIPADLQFNRDRALSELSDAELVSLDAGQFFAVCATGFACIDAAAGIVDRTHLNTDISAYAMLTLGSGMMYQGATARPILGWYDYFFDKNHTLEPTTDVWVIRGVDGVDIKLEMLGYYGAPGENRESGNMAFRYQSLTPGFTVPEAGAEQFKVSLTASTLVGTAPLPVDFTTQQTGGTPAKWLWDFGDGTTSTEAAPIQHTYQQAGTYVARATITDQRGAISRQSVTITVNPPGQTLVAYAGPDQAILLGLGETQRQVTLSALDSYDSVDTIVSYAWVGFPKPDDVGAPAVALANGRYEFLLTVTNNRDVTAIDNVEIVLDATNNLAPYARIGATPLTGAAPLSVQFDGATSSDNDGTIVSYQWDFGDGDSSTAIAPLHAYTQPGRYIARLIVTDDDGAIAVIHRVIDVALVVPVSADTYVYEFLGNQSIPSQPTQSLLVWKHPSNHSARILMDFDGLDASLASLNGARFTATLKLYIVCDMGAGGFVGACPGDADADSPDQKARVTTDIFTQKSTAPWAENDPIAWAGVQQDAEKYATFSVNATDIWVNVDVTALVKHWVVAGSTGNGIVFSQQAYDPIRADNQSIPVLGLRSKEFTLDPSQRPYLEIRMNP